MPYRDPEKRRRYAKDYRRLRRAGDTCSTPVHPAIPIDTRLKTAADVIELLREQVGLLRADTSIGTVEKARAVGFLLTVALKAIETGNLVARVEDLERVLQSRGTSQ